MILPHDDHNGVDSYRKHESCPDLGKDSQDPAFLALVVGPRSLTEQVAQKSRPKTRRHMRKRAHPLTIEARAKHDHGHTQSRALFPPFDTFPLHLDRAIILILEERWPHACEEE